jgi:hypothetical protein
VNTYQTVAAQVAQTKVPETAEFQQSDAGIVVSFFVSDAEIIELLKQEETV